VCDAEVHEHVSGVCVCVCVCVCVEVEVEVEGSACLRDVSVCAHMNVCVNIDL
jgi:hypothetical protein